MTSPHAPKLAALAAAWLVFGVIVHWSGASRRRTVVIGLVLAVRWWAITMTAIAIDNISFV